MSEHDPVDPVDPSIPEELVDLAELLEGAGRPDALSLSTVWDTTRDRSVAVYSYGSTPIAELTPAVAADWAGKVARVAAYAEHDAAVLRATIDLGLDPQARERLDPDYDAAHVGVLLVSRLREGRTDGEVTLGPLTLRPHVNRAGRGTVELVWQGEHLGGWSPFAAMEHAAHVLACAAHADLDTRYVDVLSREVEVPRLQAARSLAGIGEAIDGGRAIDAAELAAAAGAIPEGAHDTLGESLGALTPAMAEAAERRLAVEETLALRTGAHLWQVAAGFAVDRQTLADGAPVALTVATLRSAGPGCYLCEQPYDPRLARRRCKGHP